MNPAQNKRDLTNQINSYSEYKGLEGITEKYTV